MLSRWFQTPSSVPLAIWSTLLFLLMVLLLVAALNAEPPKRTYNLKWNYNCTINGSPNYFDYGTYNGAYHPLGQLQTTNCTGTPTFSASGRANGLNTSTDFYVRAHFSDGNLSPAVFAKP